MAGQFKLKFMPTINGMTTYEDAAPSIVGFKLYSSIYSGLPIGYFDFYDETGEKRLQQFENLQTGAVIDFTLYSAEETGNEINKDFSNLELKNYVVLYTEVLSTSEDNSQVGGIIRVWFGNRLFLYKDMTNHAYPALSADALVKRVLECEDRGFAFEIDKKNFDKAEGDPSIRYKCNESDWEFLHKKVIPYSTFEKLPMMLFCNIKEEFFFKSFKSLYSKESNTLYSPISIDDKSGDAYKEFISSNPTIKNFETFKNVYIKVGGPEMVQQVQKKFSIEDAEMSKVLGGMKGPSNISGSEGGLSNLVPMDRALVLNSTGTSSQVYRNHALADCVSLVQTDSLELDKAFSIEFDANLNPNKYLVGETVTLYIKKGHWMNGKWLITNLTIFTPENDGDSLMQRVTIRRPSFDGNKSETTLASLAMIHKVE